MWAPLLLMTLQGQLDSVLADPKLDGAIVSATLTDLSGKVLYQHNSSIHVVPASNEKLFTAAYALNTLGPNYQPRTDIWKLPDRTVVDSPGDPLMTHDLLVQAAQRLDLDHRLAVYVREAYAPGIPTSWELSDVPNKYAAPVTAFTVDRGSFELWNMNGMPRLLPEPYGVKVDRIPDAAVRSLHYDPFTRKVTVAGALPATTNLLDTLALPRPDEAAASVLGRFFLMTDATPARAPDLSILGSDLATTLGACLPPSDNNIAEHLLLMAAKSQGALGAAPYVVARQRLANFLTRFVGLSSQDFSIDDGSGLSRHNLVTTRAIAKLLAWSETQPTANVWRRVLATPGHGTLAGRLKGVTFQGKTGTLETVVAISGYVRTASKKEAILSVVLNNFLCTSDDARTIADNFVRTVSNSEL